MSTSASGCPLGAQIAPVIDMLAARVLSCSQRARPPWQWTARLSNSVMGWSFRLISNTPSFIPISRHEPARWTACSPVHRERVAEHRPTALGLLLSRLVLDHIPVLGKKAILDPKNVGCNQ